MIKAIETTYKGYRFRSRLEARWAVFFDALGIKWEYEPEGFELPNGNRYLPDFKVDVGGAKPAWFEVKGVKPDAKELTKLRMLVEGTGSFGFLAWGTMDVPVVYPDGSISGANIRGIAPSSAWAPGGAFRDCPEGLRGWAVEFEESMLSGFYEDGSGQVHLDHLYTRDLPVMAGSKGRVVEKVSIDGELVPTLNVGEGRLYRSDRMVRAYAAARSARFEFGQSGASL